MIEPLLMLTFLNCFFMFSTTVTTCALWWKKKEKKCCGHSSIPKNTEIKREISSTKLKNDNKNLSKKSLQDKREIVPIRSQRNCRKIRYGNESSDEKSFGRIMAQPVSKEVQQQQHQQRDNVVYEKLPSTETIIPRQIRSSQSSKRDNTTKSTVVMEFSTTQKVVQIVDNDNDKSKISPIETTSYRIDPPERRIEFCVKNKSNESS